MKAARNESPKAATHGIPSTPSGLAANSNVGSGVSVYGLGRFPVILYTEQWEKLLGMADDIRAFIAEHETELKTKEKEG